MLPADQKLVSLMDIGINLANPRFKQDLHAVLTRAKQSGVDDLMITGVSEESSRAAIKLCKQHNLRKGEELPRLRCTVGVHPHDAKDFDMSKTPAVLEELLADDVVAAVGECGLDFNRMYSPQDVQIAVFERQIEIAKKCSKPLFLHERDAHEAFVGILRKHRPTLRNNIVVHCFTGTLEQMKEYIALDCYIGFTGFICDEREGRGAHLKRVVQATPVDRIMIETDGPFILPRNCPKYLTHGNRCEPAHLVFVARKLAEFRGIAVNTDEYVALMQQIMANSTTFFGLTRSSDGGNDGDETVSTPAAPDVNGGATTMSTTSTSTT